MAVNDISPGFVRVFYSRGTINHTMTLPVKPSSPVAGVTGNELIQADGNPVEFSTGIQAFVGLLSDITISSVSFSRAELWSKPTPQDNPLFVESKTLAIDGDSGATPPAYTQLVMTHRTALGGLHRLYVFGSAFDINIRDVAPFSSPAASALTDYLTSDVSWVFGRDNGRLISPIALSTKVNDAVRRRELGI